MAAARVRQSISGSLLIITCSCLAACSSVTGYPANPYSSTGDLAALVANSGPEALQVYYGSSSPAQREALRNQIIYSRLAAYDIEFQNFQADLVKESNLESLGGDLAVLGLTGAGAVTGGAGLKAALSAAATGLTGAKASVSKELFFDRAVPAILAQMSASRALQLDIIAKGLQLPDHLYPLPSALMDANAYREAGSIPSAINALTANATGAKAERRAALTLEKLGPAGLDGIARAPASALFGPAGTGSRAAPSAVSSPAIAVFRNSP